MYFTKGVPMSIHDVRLDALFNLGNYLISSFSCSDGHLILYCQCRLCDLLDGRRGQTDLESGRDNSRGMARS